MGADTITILLTWMTTIFNATSVQKATDLDKHTARELLRTLYNDPGPESIERHLEVVERLRQQVGP